MFTRIRMFPWIVRGGIVAMLFALVYGHFSFKEGVFLVVLGASWSVLVLLLEAVVVIADKLLHEK
jgi:Na+/H+ antiporter NhaC